MTKTKTKKTTTATFILLGRGGGNQYLAHFKILSKISSFHQKYMKHAKKQQRVTHAEEKQVIETAFKGA